MGATMGSRTLTVSIGRRAEDVYAFVAHPRNMPGWAKAFCKSVRQVEGRWVIDTPAGEAVIRFVEENALGVLDHFVTVAPGTDVYVPMRVVANGEGSEVMLTVFRREGMTEEVFQRDVGMVERDLATLKEVMER